MFSTYGYSIDKVVVTHCEATQPPQQIDYEETKILLRDFGIENITVPDCQRLHQLLSWRKDVINKHLDNWNQEKTSETRGMKRKVTREQFTPHYERTVAARFSATSKKAIAAELSVSTRTVERLINEMRSAKKAEAVMVG